MLNDNLEDYHLQQTVMWIHKLFKGKVTFCGSFGLAMNGFLNREIHDVDCITEKDFFGMSPEKYMPKKLIEATGFYPSIYKSKSAKFTVNGARVKCFKLVSPYGVSVDVMYCKGLTKLTRHRYAGRWINVETPESCIAVKKAYLENWKSMEGCTGQSVEKHRSDIAYYKNKINNVI